VEKGLETMRRSLVASSVLVLIALATLPAQAATTTVSVADFAFTPSAATVAQGGSVNWHNNGPSTHTSTQNTPLGMWNTGNIARGTTSASVTLLAAGVYKYHCAIHPTMLGSVKVPIVVSPRTGTTATTFTITLASATQSGFTYEVQRKVGSGSYATYKTGVTTRTLTFKGSAGTYSFRSRLHKTSNGATSNYSPAMTITIS
jgi:plastocyanin